MCLLVYIASDVSLPLVPFDESRPAFNVTEVRDQIDVIRRRFTKHYIYSVGSHTGCGCGFEDAEQEYPTKPSAHSAEAEAGRQSRQQLADYLMQALATQERIELFACWEGEQARETTRWATIAPEDLVDNHRRFLDAQDFAPEFLVVVRKARATSETETPPARPAKAPIAEVAAVVLFILNVLAWLVVAPFFAIIVREWTIYPRAGDAATGMIVFGPIIFMGNLLFLLSAYALNVYARRLPRWFRTLAVIPPAVGCLVGLAIVYRAVSG